MSKSYFISGGNRGIGFSLVKTLSSSSSNTVVASARNVAEAHELKKWAETHSNVKIVSLDTSRAESNIAAAKETAHLLPQGLDVLIANAGIAKSAMPVLDCSDELYYDHFTVNTVGPIRLLRAFKPLLDQKPTKQFAVISSMAGSIDVISRVPMPLSAYGMSKAAINYLVKQLHLELSSQGYKCVAIHPGAVSSDMGKEAMESDFLKNLSGNFSFITPEESASAINENILKKMPEVAGKFMSYDSSEVAW
ncbi:LAME_0G13828g1_1 [Lachancea meyersii CBS 8951]|uniref:LAME_0G13828g1_1 n=1 Tax=Lachancea meyersii CBS 8951 TaxID=1266667 RepID=A0A1G4KA58_9SACH|nr:LAME_0G13828g1_1 [Lachancea meyersii CBS 8951]